MNLSSEQTRARPNVRGVFAAALLLACAALAALAQDARRPTPRKPVIRQTSQATCGPAALATLLTFYLDDPVTEAELVAQIGKDGKTMTNLDELVKACKARGHKAEGYCLGEKKEDKDKRTLCRLTDGYRVELPKLLRVVGRRGVPVLVRFKEPILHFVLAVGGVDDFVLIADPAQGEVAIHRSDFLRRWDGFALVVTPARPVKNDLAERRRRAAETRLETLRRAGSRASAPRF
ncbi:MAG TPA: cysteine peptidase family C39 domain-containing protein [Pyrinomonadaceae bacterium]|nr:cysteine peptidase family C39 domain-containing protein [Pyrinomonadaceae bacterium]